MPLIVSSTGVCFAFYREAESGFRRECPTHTRILFPGSRSGFAQQQLLQLLQTNPHHASSTRQVQNGSFFSIEPFLNTVVIDIMYGRISFRVALIFSKDFGHKREARIVKVINIIGPLHHILSPVDLHRVNANSTWLCDAFSQ